MTVFCPSLVTQSTIYRESTEEKTFCEPIIGSYLPRSQVYSNCDRNIIRWTLFTQICWCRLTVIRLKRNKQPMFLTAERTRSLDSLTEVLGSPTIIKASRPLDPSTSTSTSTLSSPMTAHLCIFTNIGNTPPQLRCTHYGTRGRKTNPSRIDWQDIGRSKAGYR